MNEALSKLRTARLPFDILIGATVDVLGQLIESKLAQDADGGADQDVEGKLGRAQLRQRRASSC